ncbi:tyrosine-type recombinase/integrase [Pleurocapsales cyanobacterium LEGE 10410]|nr:tyrosine-type recombinase/integrase [Pleurocapsales cyanobacterium LEGE 10410]
MLTVYPSGKKSFSYEYNYDGKKRRLTFGEYGQITLKQARDKVNEAKYKLKQGFDPQVDIDERKSNKPNTISTVAERYMQDYISQLAPKTQTEYIRYLNDHILPEFGDYKLSDLPRGEIKTYLNQIANIEGHPITANRLKATLSGLYTFHIKEGFDVLDPTKNIDKFKERPKERVYSNNEIKELWHFFDEMNEPLGSLYKILLLIARRKSETWSAKWDHLQDNKWTFPAENVKTNNTFVIPITELTEKILLNLKQANPDSTFIFQSPKSKDFHIVSDSNAKKKIRDNTSIKDFTPHDLRRTAITKLSEVGTPRDVAEKISNHSQGRTNNSFNIYDKYDRFNEMSLHLNTYHRHLLKLIK